MKEENRKSADRLKDVLRDDRIKVAKAGRRYLIAKQSLIEYMTQED